LSDIEQRLRAAVAALPRGLREHVLRVEVEAVRLATRYGVDVGRARVAALGHDLVRHKRPEELLTLAKRYGHASDEIELATPILVHGPVAARMLADDYAVADADVIAGVDCHTTARAGMSDLEKVLFIADKSEPQKLAERPAWDEVRRLADESLDAALLRFLDLHIEEALERRWLLHPRTLEARNALLRSDGII
jgi:predicted HD superfamily hydrolase involved in NAD metabolism